MTTTFEPNFIEKSKLSNEEFMKYYEQLWESTPHYFSDWPNVEEITQNKTEGIKIYNSEGTLPGEVWDKYPDNPKYLVSSLGRIKYCDGRKSFWLKQDDNGKTGYLVLQSNDEIEQAGIKLNKNTYVYTFVAKTFLGKEDGDGLHVHHIDNNGYDCSTKNLILLTAEQHRAIHSDRKLTPNQLEDFLQPEKNYNEYKIKLHLSNYKLNKGIVECGVYKKNGKKYSHILPEEKDNLITVSYNDEMNELYEEMKPHLHQYFSHLSSSQALCFNLFEPLIIEKKLDLIDSSITPDAIAEFEHIEKNSFENCSKDKDKTNFDFFIQDGSNKYFFELKYTEQSFGYVSNYSENDSHDKKYKDYYKAQLAEIAPDIDEKQFFDNYQLWRNVCHVTEGKVFFVFLKDRKDLERDVEYAKSLCGNEYKNKIESIFIEDIVQKALKIKENEKIHSHYKEFYDKYLDY